MCKIIDITRDNIADEAICCAISDKKCREGYALKKKLLKEALGEGYRFRKFDLPGKVFVEFGSSSFSMVPLVADDYMVINCFWVSGQYKGQGYGKRLLQSVIDDSRQLGYKGVLMVTGKKKIPYFGDVVWLQRQGFEIVDSTDYGFLLLRLPLGDELVLPRFADYARRGICEPTDGLVVYYSERCPFTTYYVKEELTHTARSRHMSLEIRNISELRAAQQSPTVATIFSLFYNGVFLTSDVGVCKLSRFDKVIGDLKK